MNKHRILTKKQFENLYKLEIIKLYHNTIITHILNTDIIDSNKKTFETDFNKYLKGKLYYSSIIQ